MPRGKCSAGCLTLRPLMVTCTHCHIPRYCVNHCQLKFTCEDEEGEDEDDHDAVVSAPGYADWMLERITAAAKAMVTNKDRGSDKITRVSHDMLFAHLFPRQTHNRVYWRDVAASTVICIPWCWDCLYTSFRQRGFFAYERQGLCTKHLVAYWIHNANEDKPARRLPVFVNHEAAFSNSDNNDDDMPLTRMAGFGDFARGLKPLTRRYNTAVPFHMDIAKGPPGALIPIPCVSDGLRGHRDDAFSSLLSSDPDLILDPELELGTLDVPPNHFNNEHVKPPTRRMHNGGGISRPNEDQNYESDFRESLNESFNRRHNYVSAIGHELRVHVLQKLWCPEAVSESSYIETCPVRCTVDCVRAFGRAHERLADLIVEYSGWPAHGSLETTQKAPPPPPPPHPKTPWTETFRKHVLALIADTTIGVEHALDSKSTNTTSDSKEPVEPSETANQMDRLIEWLCELHANINPQDAANGVAEDDDGHVCFPFKLAADGPDDKEHEACRRALDAFRKGGGEDIHVVDGWAFTKAQDAYTEAGDDMSRISHYTYDEPTRAWVPW